jgi:hypothetical protein
LTGVDLDGSVDERAECLRPVLLAEVVLDIVAESVIELGDECVVPIVEFGC